MEVTYIMNFKLFSNSKMCIVIMFEKNDQFKINNIILIISLKIYIFLVSSD